MKIAELIKKKKENIYQNESITIAFIGDSTTQGCFECYLDESSIPPIKTVTDSKCAYSTRVKEILNFLYPEVQINIINSGINGDNAQSGLNRLERDVLRYNPDLVIVSFGLNDSAKGEEYLQTYKQSLSKIFDVLNEKGIESLFLTENCMNTEVSPHLQGELFINLAKRFASDIQNSGLLKKFFDSAKQICLEKNVKVCDLYSIWERFIALGVNVTELLANKLNHPVREFQQYVAIKLVECMLFE